MKKLVLIVLIVGITGQVFSQRHKYHEKIQAEKVAFLTDELDLTVTEAQKFWPVYNEHQKQEEELVEREREILRVLDEDIKNKSESFIEKKIDVLLDLRTQKAKLNKEFFLKYKKVLPVKKVALLYRADKKFKRHLLEKYRKCGKGGMRSGGSGHQAPLHH